MTVKDFYEYYDLTDTIVLEIKTMEEGLSIVIDAHLSMYFVANGFRSEFDDYFCHQFIFKGNRTEIELSDPIDIKEYHYENGVLSFLANGNKIEIPETDIIIHKNHERK